MSVNEVVSSLLFGVAAWAGLFTYMVALAAYSLASGRNTPWIPERSDVFAPTGMFAIAGCGAFALALAIQVAS